MNDNEPTCLESLLKGLGLTVVMVCAALAILGVVYVLLVLTMV